MEQNTRFLFWDDPRGLSGLAARVARRQEVSSPAVVPQPRSAREPASAAASSPVPSASAASSPVASSPDDRSAAERAFPEATGSIEDRLAALLRWLRQLTGAHRVFVADEEGLPLAGHGASDALVAGASAVGNGWNNIHRGLGLPLSRGLSIDFEGDGSLRVLTAATDGGRWTLGFVTREPVGLDELSLIGSALERCLKGDGEPERKDDEA